MGSPPRKIAFSKGASFILNYPQDNITKILSKKLDGYSEWKQLDEKESFGDLNLTVDGFFNKNVKYCFKQNNTSRLVVLVDIHKCTVTFLYIG